MTDLALEPPPSLDLPAGAIKLLESFDDLAADVGLRNVGLREVARRAGLSHGAPAHFFGSMEGMVRAHAVWSGESLGDVVYEMRDATADRPGRERLVAESEVFIEWALAHPARFDALFRPGDSGHDPIVAEVRDFTLRCLGQVVATAVESKELVGEPGELTLEIWSTTLGLASMLLDGVLPGDDPLGQAHAVVANQIRRMA